MGPIDPFLGELKRAQLAGQLVLAASRRAKAASNPRERAMDQPRERPSPVHDEGRASPR